MCAAQRCQGWQLIVGLEKMKLKGSDGECQPQSRKPRVYYPYLLGSWILCPSQGAARNPHKKQSREDQDTTIVHLLLTQCIRAVIATLPAYPNHQVPDLIPDQLAQNLPLIVWLGKCSLFGVQRTFLPLILTSLSKACFCWLGRSAWCAPCRVSGWEVLW